jgi:hypothetical protein
MQQLYILVLIMYSSYGVSSAAGRGDLTSPRTAVATHHVTKYTTPIHNILSTTLQSSVSQKALENLPEDGNVMPKRVAATILIN